MPYFGQELFLQAQEKGPLTSPAYRRRWSSCRRLSRALGIDAVMAKHRLDALVAPTGNPAWPTDLVNGDHFTGSQLHPRGGCRLPEHQRADGIRVRACRSISPSSAVAWSEPTLIRIGFAFEQATKHRRPPRFLPTTELSPA